MSATNFPPSIPSKTNSNPNSSSTSAQLTSHKTAQIYEEGQRMSEIAMEESSPATIQFRKRKGAPPSASISKPLLGILTRCKSRMYFRHTNRSGVSRSDMVRWNPIMLHPKIESTEALPEGNIGISSVKDLRTRRVFTPEVISVHLKEEEECGDGKQLKVSDEAPGSSPGLDCVQKVDELEKPEVHGERNNLKNGLDYESFAGNNSVSERKTDLNRRGRRKVFRAPSSFSYRRLLPYLTDILNDDSSVPKIEIFDDEMPCKLQKLDDVSSNVPSVVESRFSSNWKHLDGANYSENGGIKRVCQNVSFDQQKLSAAENMLGRAENTNRPVHMEQKGNQDGGNSDNAPMEEECCQTTPPEPDVTTKIEFARGMNCLESCYMHAENQDYKSQLVSDDGCNVGIRQSLEGKPGADSISRSVLNPCSRLRQFRNMGSVSYRRLLPFLMDISKSNTSSPRTIQNPDPPVDSKEDLHPQPSAASEQNEKHCTENLIQMGSLHSSNDSSPDSNLKLSSSPPNLTDNYSSQVKLSCATSETAVDSHELKDHRVEVMPQPQSTPKKIELGFDWDNSSALETPSPDEIDINNKPSTSEEPETVEKQMKCCVVLKNHESNEELVQKVSTSHLTVPINGSFKGILKRNRHGCRGLCNCLNCSSFRLHAEKAFEFSQNQMHDAEEVASELMKELASLRVLLEKSITNAVDQSASQLNPVDVAAACNSALDTENFAKQRLSQMKDDLNIHCRIPDLLQPRVTFANHMQEKAITEF